MFDNATDEQLFLRVAKKYALIEESRLILVRSLDDLIPSQIRCGIVFFLAVWSGPSMVAYGTLNKSLATLELGDLRMYVASIDILTREFVQEHFAETRLGGGWGETFWIRDGKVIHELQGYDAKQAEQIEEYTRHTLIAAQTP